MNTRPASDAPRTSPRGFTLIELLTVIAIIGILAAIIIPVVGKVRTTAKRAQGLSNLRQVNLAGLAYVNENKGMWYYDTNRQTQNQAIDGAYYYPKFLTRYISSAAIINRPFGEYFYDPMVGVKADNVMHFAVIRVLFGDTNNPGYNNFNKITRSSTQVFFADGWTDPVTGSAGSTINDTGFNAYFIGGAVNESTGSSVPPVDYRQQNQHLDLTRDRGQTKLAFLDGHVAIVKREALYRRLFDPRFNR
jgi:prepilin-type N-terminal cleavage/methylation domain-containing protein